MSDLSPLRNVLLDRFDRAKVKILTLKRPLSVSAENVVLKLKLAIVFHIFVHLKLLTSHHRLQ